MPEKRYLTFRKKELRVQASPLKSPSNKRQTRDKHCSYLCSCAASDWRSYFCIFGAVPFSSDTVCLDRKREALAFVIKGLIGKQRSLFAISSFTGHTNHNSSTLTSVLRMHLDLSFTFFFRIMSIAGARRPFAPIGDLTIDYGKIWGSLLLLLTIEAGQLCAWGRCTKLHVSCIHSDAWLKGGKSADGSCFDGQLLNGRGRKKQFSIITNTCEESEHELNAKLKGSGWESQIEINECHPLSGLLMLTFIIVCT